jgi:hypothetical protein
MNMMKAAAIGAVALLLTCSSAFADVQLTLQDGRVSIVAKDATVRQILTEWARVGQTKIVNVEKIPGPPMTLELTNMPEQQALDLLLRTVSGYMAAARPIPGPANVSTYDRIVVMPTPAPPRTALAAAPAPGSPTPAAYPQPNFPQPQVAADDDADDERPQPNVPMAQPVQRGPVFNTFPATQSSTVAPQVMPPGGFPQPQQQQPPPVAQPQAQPTAPYGGVAVPGMVVQPPQQPGVQQGIVPGQPVRRPGGPEGQ